MLLEKKTVCFLRCPHWKVLFQRECRYRHPLIIHFPFWPNTLIFQWALELDKLNAPSHPRMFCWHRHSGTALMAFLHLLSQRLYYQYHLNLLRFIVCTCAKAISSLVIYGFLNLVIKLSSIPFKYSLFYRLFYFYGLEQKPFSYWSLMVSLTLWLSQKNSVWNCT